MSQPEAQQVHVLGKPLRCVVCGNDQFYVTRAQLNTALATFFKFDWVNPSADCCICAQCAYIHWFYPQKQD